MKIPKIYYIGLIISLLLLCLIEQNKRQELDWSTTYSSRDKIPYGTHVLYDMVTQGHWGDSLSRTNESFYTISITDTISAYNLVYIAQDIQFDFESNKQLLHHVSKGNQVLLVASRMPKKLMAKFGLEIKTHTLPSDNNTFQINSQVSFTDTIKVNKILANYKSISWGDTTKNVKALGTQNERTNFVAISHGKGQLYIHVNPQPFSNYYLLKDLSFDYINEIFALLSDAPLIWDDYMNNGSRSSTSELRYILQFDAIRFAFKILWLMLLLYLGLSWRRQQRAIPIIEAPRNNSVDFIATLTNLYLSNINHGMIASYRIRSFKRKITKRYGIHWNKSPEIVKQQLLVKCKIEDAQADKLISIIYKTDIKKIDQNTLIEINHTLDEYTS